MYQIKVIAYREREKEGSFPVAPLCFFLFLVFQSACFSHRLIDPRDMSSKTLEHTRVNELSSLTTYKLLHVPFNHGKCFSHVIAKKKKIIKMLCLWLSGYEEATSFNNNIKYKNVREEKNTYLHIQLTLMLIETFFPYKWYFI